MLIITNGDAAVAALKAAGVRAAYLPWRDVLHEGPVPAGVNLEELSDVRARFIAARGWGTLEEVARDFARRDRRLANARHHQEIVLWFEHDLYDQLQLLQILAWLAENSVGEASLDLICREEFVSDMDADVAPVRLQQREPVTGELLALGARAWEAFTGPDPRAWEPLARAIDHPLPYLASTFRRLLEELPDAVTGLSRSERQILGAVAEGAGRPGELFRVCQRREDAVFMGDASFFFLVHRLASGSAPALAVAEGAAFEYPPPLPPTRDWLDQTLSLTPTGVSLREGASELGPLPGEDRWLGGVRLDGQPDWRWDAQAERVVVRGAAAGA